MSRSGLDLQPRQPRQPRHDRLHNVPKPRRALGPVGGSVLGLLAWAAVAHNSGAGWVQTLGALLGAFLLVGLLTPGIVVARARVTIVANPADAVAGLPMEIECEVSRPVRIRPVNPPGQETVTGKGAQAKVTLVPAHRGEISRCRLEIASGAPFGIMWWARVLDVELARHVLVAPKMGDPAPDQRDGIQGRGEDGRRVDARVGEPRGVRPYVPGDLRHWVNWPATAHTGMMMVREMEGPTDPPVTVDAVLPGDLDEAEGLAGRALATVARHLNQGRIVLLVTDEGHGPTTEPVHSVAEAGRRLARAYPLATPMALARAAGMRSPTRTPTR